MEEYLDFQDVLLMPASESTINSRTKPTLLDQRGEVPLSIANMETTGTFEVAKIAAKRGWKTYIHKHHTHLSQSNSWYKFINEVDIRTFNLTIPTFGTNKDDFAKAEELRKLCEGYYGLAQKNICFDIANGHLFDSWKAVAEFLLDYPYENVIFGNIANPSAVYSIYNILSRTKGLSLKSISLKVGIGSGSVCSTRTVTGVGVPQFTLIKKCYDAVAPILDNRAASLKETPNLKIISDGGIRCSGDVVKAFVAGADEVMMGGMFAGCYETGDIFYGSSSEMAKGHTDRTPEGLIRNIQRNKSVDEQIVDIEGGIRSAMTYLNAGRLSDFANNRDFYLSQVIKVRRQTDNF